MAPEGLKVVQLGNLPWDWFLRPISLAAQYTLFPLNSLRSNQCRGDWVSLMPAKVLLAHMDDARLMVVPIKGQKFDFQGKSLAEN